MGIGPCRETLILRRPASRWNRSRGTAAVKHQGRASGEARTGNLGTWHRVGGGKGRGIEGGKRRRLAHKKLRIGEHG